MYFHIPDDSLPTYPVQILFQKIENRLCAGKVPKTIYMTPIICGTHFPMVYRSNKIWRNKFKFS